jgi:AAA15 family ATPase/GTPase
MLLDFEVKNFFSFKEGVKISFRVSESCPPEFSKGKEYVSILGIKGANGSGKTNILRAFSFLNSFCTTSFSTEPSASIGMKTFFGSKRPAEFRVDFIVNGINYLYTLAVDNNRVHSESLYRKLKRKTKLFERVGDQVLEATEEFAPLRAMKLRSNASIISIAHHHEVLLIKDVYDFFSPWFTNVSYGGLGNGPSIYSIAEQLKDIPDYLEFVRGFIASCDGGVSDIKIQEVVKEDGDKVLVPMFVHAHEGKPHKISHVTESSGTKALFKYLFFYKAILDTGGLLILDEFDITLHPHILPKLLDLFDNPATNPNGAQMIFSTHNGEVLDWLGRYRCYLVNKEDNESYAYRLDELPADILRNGRPIAPAYNRGDLGGIPKL